MSTSESESAGRRPDRYFIETWGCQMNVLDADKMAGALERHGYVRADCVDNADVVLLNTCSIREKAQDKVFSELGRLKPIKDLRPDVVLGVCGCVAQQEGDGSATLGDVLGDDVLRRPETDEDDERNGA